MSNVVVMPRHATPPPADAVLAQMGQRLARVRRALGYTQESFADTFGCGRSAVANWERGAYPPDVYAMMRLSDRHDVPIEYIYQGKTARLPQQLAEVLLNENPQSARRRVG